MRRRTRGIGRSGRSGRAGLLGIVVAFLRSPQGQRLLREARLRYDTPANRAKLREAFGQLRSQRFR